MSAAIRPRPSVRSISRYSLRAAKRQAYMLTGSKQVATAARMLPTTTIAQKAKSEW
jgi:hypothetical protein